MSNQNTSPSQHSVTNQNTSPSQHSATNQNTSTSQHSATNQNTRVIQRGSKHNTRPSQRTAESDQITTRPSQYSTYHESTGIKPCVSEPTCSVHKHRPRPLPCPEPDKCYQKCIRSKNKCESAMSIVTRSGSPCECARVQSQGSRHSLGYSNATHKRRLERQYRNRSIISRWYCKNPPCRHGERVPPIQPPPAPTARPPPKKKCCVVL